MKSQAIRRVRTATPFLMAGLIVGFSACGNRADRLATVETLPECEAYASRYEECIAKLGDRDIAVQRAATLRDGLRLTNGDDESRRQLKESCVAGFDRLALACR